MPINVAEAIDGDTAEVVTVRRYATGAYVDGAWVQGVPATFSTLASVQQPTKETLQMLPEAERSKDLRLFICRMPVHTGDDRANSTADELGYNGEWFRVVQAGDWSAYGHNSVIAARML